MRSWLTVLMALFLPAMSRAQQAPEIPSTLQFSENPPLYSALPEPLAPKRPPVIMELPQVVMHFDHEAGQSIVVEPQARVALSLIPVGNEHPAPLSTNAIMLCRPYAIQGDGHLFLRCGMDHYIVSGISFVEPKQ